MYDRLGNEPDTHIAADFGMSKQRVAQIRERAGIGRHKKARKYTLSPGATRLLGKVNDRLLAYAAGVPYNAIRNRRIELGIPAHGIHFDSKIGILSIPSWLEPHLHELGKHSDKSIAKQCDQPQATISRWRRRLGIDPLPPELWKPGGRPPRT